MDSQLTEEFSARIAGAFGQDGVEWLNQLPQILEKAANRWSLRLLPPFQPLSYNYVAPAVGPDGEPVVLKTGVPRRELSTEIDALRHYNGQGTVRLIEADSGSGLMLLERILPGVPLMDTPDDDRATSVFAHVMRQLDKPPPDNNSFPSVSDWARGFERLRNQFNGKTGPFPKPVFDRAEGMMSELLSSMSDSVVLHGDLHHWNILSAEPEPWLALDPKGVMGEPAYEVGAWLRNPFPQILDWPHLTKITARRVDIMVETLGFDRSRIIGWAYCQAVLSAVWSFEDGLDDWDGSLAIADHIFALMSESPT
ncbi:MAG: aminoglycoside phosphotransferase family protein [candidate division Zixibacteria bacterium]|nr:aminoglycoside phosphotransferase family protein [candidate division Zixibacteria bacterium]MDH3937620.1 aminoglycoside phosphotransferase family protein [candidate division Zixibacteria bacterium]MDH4032385.1 aminoglycoside phosphotransferase family protein [candidate division Zixibacteria bacterium]